MKSYLLKLTAVSIFAAVIRRMTSDSGTGRAARLGAGLLILLTALGPLATINLVDMAQRIVKREYGDVLTTIPVDKAANELMEQLITDTVEAYILDKAQALEMDITVEIIVETTSGYPIPWEARLKGSWTVSQKAQLTEVIREELGIPVDRQRWQ